MTFVSRGYDLIDKDRMQSDLFDNTIFIARANCRLGGLIFYGTFAKCHQHKAGSQRKTMEETDANSHWTLLIKDPNDTPQMKM